MVDIANYDIKHINKMTRLEKLQESKWEHMKTLKKALTYRVNGDNMVLSSLINTYNMELNRELSDTLKLIEVLYTMYIDSEGILIATRDKILTHNLIIEMNTIKGEIDKLKRNVLKLEKYKI